MEDAHKSESNSYKLKPWQYVVIAVVFLVLFSSQYGLTSKEIASKKPVGISWYNCIEYVKSGELYEGHASCARGPIFFYILTAFSLVFGDPASDVYQISIMAFMFILQIIGFIIYLKILKKMNYKGNLFLPIIFFLLLSYTTTNSFESYLSLIFIALAYMVINFSEKKYKFLLTGLLAGMAFFLNITSLVIFALIMISYSIFDKKQIKISRSGLNLDPHLIKQYLHILAGFVSVLIFFLILHPNVLIYHAFVHFDLTTTVSYITALKAMLLNLKIRYYLVLVLIGTLFYFFWKTRKGIYFISSVGLLASTLQMTKNGFLFTRTLLTGTHYILLSLFFVSIALSFMIKENIFLKNKNFFIPLLIIILIFPGYISSPLQDKANNLLFGADSAQKDFNELKHDVEDVLGYIINPNQIKTLMYENKGYDIAYPYLVDRGVNLKEISFDSPDNRYLGQGALYDPTLLEPFKRLLKDDYTNWVKTHPVDLNKTGLEIYKKRAAERYYDMIIEGPPSWAATIEILNDNDAKQAISDYCVLYIPDLSYPGKAGRHNKGLLIKDRTLCIKIANDIVKYYAERYNTICSKDQNIMNERIVPLMANYGVNFPICEIGNSVTEKIVTDVPTAEYKALVIDPKEQIIHAIAILIIFALFLIKIELPK